MASYKHGIYTENAATVGQIRTKAIGTIPVYIGTAPQGKINTPTLINSLNDFTKEFGYSEEWGDFTLCEAAYAHFANSVRAIAPIVVINIYDTAVHKTEGEVDLTKITKTNFEAGLAAVDTVTIKCGVTPNIIVAPYFDQTYASEIIAKCESLIAGKWGCVAYIDIPTEENDTLTKAIAYKTTKKIASKYARLHYPKSKHNGKVFHLSVLDAVATQIVDTDTNGVACRSSSNKRIMCDVPVIDANTEIIYSEADANTLNANGITTINYIGGGFRLWGGHMANYDAATVESIESKDRSDASVRMQIYLDNWLKKEHIDNIDAPLTRRDVDNVVSNVNIGLSSFVNSGYLLRGVCYFDEGNNAMTELADGNLVLDVLHTEVPNGKSISFRMAYDVSGLETLYETEEV